MDPLGLDNLTKAVQALQPVLRDFADALSELTHSVLTRVDGAEINIKITIPPAQGRVPPRA